MKIELRNGKVKELRKADKVPGVMYGKTIDATPIQIEYADLRKALNEFGTSMTFEATLDGEKHLVYVKETQEDFLQNYKVIHVDLMKVSTDDTLHSNIPLNFLHRDEIGGVGEVLSIVLNEVEAEVRVGKGVSHLDVDMLILKDADGVYIKDIVVPEGINLLHDPEDLVANITTVSELVVETDEDEEDVDVIVGAESDEDDEEETEEE